MKAILTVSFGTTHADMRERAIDPVELDMAQAFPDWQAFSAWTSTRVVEKVRERGEWHDTLDEALARIAKTDPEELVVQPTCLMQGHEMRKITHALESWKGNAPIRLGTPALSSNADRQAIARAITNEFAHVPETEMLVLMGHGGRTGGNEVFSLMNDEFAALGMHHIYVATLEGQPNVQDMLKAIKLRQPTLVHLAPLMIVAGDHAVVDMAGDGADSWEQRIQALGFATNPIIRGLGEYPAIREIIVDHARKAQSFTRKVSA